MRRTDVTKVSHQSDKERQAGYQIGLAGGPEPKKQEGRSRWYGWHQGKQSREAEQGLAT